MKHFSAIPLATLALLSAFSCNDDPSPAPESGKEPTEEIFELKVNLSYPEGYEKNAVKVNLTDADGTTLSSQTTDAATGRVVFDVKAGDYRLSASHRIAMNKILIGAVDCKVSAATDIELELKPERNSALIFKEIYVSSSAPNFMKDVYFEIVNNSDETQYLDQIILASMQSLMSESTWVDDEGHLIDRYHVDAWTIAFPGTGKEHPIEPGQSVVIAEDATAHATAEFPDRPDLSKADWEVFRIGSKGLFADKNDYEAPNMEIVHCNSPQVNCFGFGIYGVGLFMAKLPDGITPKAFAADEKNFEKPFSYQPEFLMIPSDYVLDAVEVVDNEEVTDESFHKNFLTQDDAGYTWSTPCSMKCIRRKVARVANGRVYYKDTNNSTEDFLPDQTPMPGRHPMQADA